MENSSSNDPKDILFSSAKVGGMEATTEGDEPQLTKKDLEMLSEFSKAHTVIGKRQRRNAEHEKAQTKKVIDDLLDKPKP